MICSSPERRRSVSEASTKRWADPDFRARQKAVRSGQRWMTHPDMGATKVKPADIDEYLAAGWVMGRGKSKLNDKGKFDANL